MDRHPLRAEPVRNKCSHKPVRVYSCSETGLGVAMPKIAAPRPLSMLPATFTYAQARAAGLSKHALYGLREVGRIETLGRGLYRQTDAEPADLDLLAIAIKAPTATLCLASALARHGLSDAIPIAPDIAGSPGMSVGEVEPGGQRRSWWRGGFGDTASELGDAPGSRF